MKSRLIASLALGAAVVLGTTGCNMLAPQATTIQYSASDGVNIPDSGPLKVRNALIIADEEGTLGNLVASIVNPTDDALALNVSIDGQPQSVQVEGNSSVTLGVDMANMTFDNVGKPGSDVLVSFQSGEGEGVRVHVPIMDGTLPYYTQFVPTPAATATPAG
ncbi:DNA modification methylase [Microbacterium sp. NPDC091382]|uniref:DNA modification methylase n=1 Tax=Microbacterium sp. NPDC091382 TaxID=3364210 RepID=UPI00382F36C4